MNRRNTFQLAASALVAPLVKWWPKPTPKVEVVHLTDCPCGCCEEPTESIVKITGFSGCSEPDGTITVYATEFRNGELVKMRPVASAHPST